MAISIFNPYELGNKAGVAQLVELHVANVVVAGSSPVSRSVHEESPVRPCGPTGFFATIVAS